MSTATTQNSLQSIQQKFQEKTNGCFKLPTNVREVIDLSTTPECSPQKFASAIEHDVNLAFDVLRLANSPLFTGHRPVSSLPNAIIRLGIRRCANLVLSSTVKGMLRELPLELEWANELLEKHSLMTATTCSLINQKFGLGFVGEEYTAGLLHDFGRLGLAAVTADEFANFDDLSFDESYDVLTLERNYLGTDHCEFGAWLIESACLPDQLADVTRWHHHDLEDANVEHRLLVALTRTADHLANYIQREESVDKYDVTKNKGLQELAVLRSNENLIREFLEFANVYENEIIESAKSIGGRN